MSRRKRKKVVEEDVPQHITYTLEELWMFSNHKPFKVRLPHWEKGQWFRVIYQVPRGAKEFIGYFDSGHGLGFFGKDRVWIKVEG